jgi:cellobiose dehydrogenase (acceptor)
MQIAHPDVQFYDFYAAWDTPIESDKEQYLSKYYFTIFRSHMLMSCTEDRSGMLAQVAPNLGPIVSATTR